MESLHLLLLVAGIGVLLWRLLRIGSRPQDLPPGPPTLPLLGNIHQMPTRDAHKQFQAWAQEYGPIYSLMLGTKTLIVISKDEVVKELLDRRSAIYSDRQDMYIGQTLCSDGLRLLMMRYGPTWRRLRKMVHAILNVNAARTYVPYQILENKQMMYEILRQPENFLDHIRRYSNSLTTTMTFGWRTPSRDDPQLKQLFHGFNEFAIINQTGTAAMIDFFPVLRWLPEFVLPTQAKARKLHQAEKKLYLSHWLRAKAAIHNGTARPCFCIDLEETQKKEPWLTDELAAYTAGTFLEAGSDTTSSTLYGFVQAMVLFPEVQRKAQEELDRVVGSDRLPEMSDEANLRYICGCVKESLRWMPTTILGAVPHAVMKDDWYEGFRIPQGAGILNNVYGIHNDPQRYPNPREFNPERYSDDEKSLYDAANSPEAFQRDQFTFGAGRRLCPGIHVAERSLFLGVARLLWTFNFHPTTDDTGKEMLPDGERLTQGFVCMPEPFQARIVPRSAKHAEVVKREWEDAKRELLEPGSLQWKETPEGMALPSLKNREA